MYSLKYKRPVPDVGRLAVVQNVLQGVYRLLPGLGDDVGPQVAAVEHDGEEPEHRPKEGQEAAGRPAAEPGQRVRLGQFGEGEEVEVQPGRFGAHQVGGNCVKFQSY